MERKGFFIDSICQLVIEDKRSRKAPEEGQCLAVHIFHMLCSARLVLACI